MDKMLQSKDIGKLSQHTHQGADSMEKCNEQIGSLDGSF